MALLIRGSYTFQKANEDAYIFKFDKVPQRERSLIIAHEGSILGYRYFSIQKYINKDRSKWKTGVFRTIDNTSYVIFFKEEPKVSCYEIIEVEILDTVQ